MHGLIFVTWEKYLRELLLTMRTAHTQMRRTPDGLAPPLFRYEALARNADGLVLLYDSLRQLCRPGGTPGGA